MIFNNKGLLSFIQKGKYCLKHLSISSLIFLLVFSCSRDETNISLNEDNIADQDYSEFRPIDLSAFELPIELMIPDVTANIGASTKPEIIHNESFIWKITAGPKFELIIEDFGDHKNRIVSKRKELEAQKSFFRIKYFIDEPNLIAYERNLIVNGLKNASQEVGVEHKSLHVYGEYIIDNITYELRCKDEGFPADQRMIIDLMVKSIRSFHKIKK